MKGTRMHLPRASVGVSRWRRFRASVDWPLIATIVVLGTVGMLNLYSATRGVRHKFDTQVGWMIVGGIAFVIATVIDYRTLVRFAWVALAITVVLLVLARVVSHPIKAGGHGATYRWLRIGGMTIQPSELAKLAVILVLAHACAYAEPSRYSWRTLAIKLAILVVPVVLIAIQPDLGTAVLLVLIILTVGFLALPSVWPVVYVVAAGLLAIPILWDKLWHYQKDRILGFIDCSVSHTKKCLQATQSIYAVGSGRVWGKGFLQGTQTHFNFVPEHWTDFPYSVWGEEWGFVGSVFLLAVFAFLLVWILNIALSARDRVGAVICVGVAAMTFWHVVVNVAMVLGIAPVVGVTLPFLSYGGSSLVTFLVAMGLVANVSLRKHGY